MTDATVSPPKGISGWLILVLIGLLVSPIRISYELLTNHWPIFRDGTWVELTSPGTEVYHALWAPLITFEIVGNLVTIALGLLTLWFFVQKSRRTPAIAMGWLVWSTAFIVVDFFAADLIPAVAAQPDPSSTKELVRTLISAAIWIPYFMVSKRVKATFVE